MQEPEWKTYAMTAYREKEAERLAQEQQSQKLQGQKLSKVLNEMLGLSVDTDTDRVEVSGVQFALGKNRAGLPAAFFVSPCCFCGEEKLDEIRDPATLGMYLSGETGLHTCPQAQEVAARQSKKTETEETPEKRLVAVLRELLLRPSY